MIVTLKLLTAHGDVLCWYRHKCHKVTIAMTALRRTPSRSSDRGHVTCTRTRVTHTQRSLSRAAAVSALVRTRTSAEAPAFFHSTFDAHCFSLVLLLSPPPQTTAHAHALPPPSLSWYTLWLGPTHIPQLTGSAESGFIPPFPSSAAAPLRNVKSETWQLHIPLSRHFHSCARLH